MISTIKSPSQFNRHMDSSLKVTDISTGLIQLFKLDKMSFYSQISNDTPNVGI